MSSFCRTFDLEAEIEGHIVWCESKTWSLDSDFLSCVQHDLTRSTRSISFTFPHHVTDGFLLKCHLKQLESRSNIVHQVWSSVNVEMFSPSPIFRTQQSLYFVFVCLSLLSSCWRSSLSILWHVCKRQVCLSSRNRHPSWLNPSKSFCRSSDTPEDHRNPPKERPGETVQSRSTNHFTHCLTSMCWMWRVTLQASSRPRVSPAHSMFEVTRRPDSFSGTHWSCGHNRTIPRLIRSE